VFKQKLKLFILSTLSETCKLCI